MRGDYEKLVEIKQALAMEIAVYKNIIEGEEKRIRKYDIRIQSVPFFNNNYFSRVSRKFSSRMTDQSNYCYITLQCILVEQLGSGLVQGGPAGRTAEVACMNR